MKTFALALAAAAALILAPVSVSAGQGEGIAAVVNDDAISISDMNDRVKLIIVSSNLPDNAEIRHKVTPQVLTVLVEEQLRMQEANKAGIEVGEADIDQGFASIAQQNSMEPGQFRELLRAKGVPVSTLRRQIRSQMAWNRFIERRLQPEIQITDGDVDARLEQIKARAGTNEYNVSEIFLPADSPAQQNEVGQLAAKLVSELRGGAPFAALARQFSQSPGAAQGGNVGWVQRGQMAAELDQVLPSLKEGGVSDPIRTTLGVHILQLNKTRASGAASLPSREQVLNQIGLERLERLQRRYMLDLKASSFIENRV